MTTRPDPISDLPWVKPALYDTVDIYDPALPDPTSLPDNMTTDQYNTLKLLCERYGVPFDPSEYHPRFDLPTGYLAGWVGPIYVGVSPEGEITS